MHSAHPPPGPAADAKTRPNLPSIDISCNVTHLLCSFLGDILGRSHVAEMLLIFPSGFVEVKSAVQSG